MGNCTGQCYVDYVALNGTAVEIEQRKKALAEGDPFSSIRSLWAVPAHDLERMAVAE